MGPPGMPYPSGMQPPTSGMLPPTGPTGGTNPGAIGGSGGSANMNLADASTDPGDPGDDDPKKDDAGTTLPPICEEGDGGVVADEDAGPLECIVAGDVKVQYRAADTNASDNQIKPHFSLVNSGTTAVNLSELTVRYWFADAGTAKLVFWCDYAQIGCGTVRGAFSSSDRTGGNHVLEVTFTSGMLAGGAATGEIQARFNKEDWSVFDETDDYSFDPSKTAFADWFKVTLYQRGTLIWGQEPH